MTATTSLTRRLQVMVVDDEALARARLRTLLGDCQQPAVDVVAEAGNASQAMELLRGHRVDVVFLDIHMPGADGLMLAQTLKTLPQPPVVVFVTAHAEHALQAFDLEAADYLTKPVRLERLQMALQKAERLAHIPSGLGGAFASDEVLVIQERHRTERVPLPQVLYFKAELKYITVRTAARSYILDGALNDLEARYAEHYLRIHRNAIVARWAIRALEKHYDAEEGEGWAVRLQGVDELLSVSRRQLATVRGLISQ
ncbi:LytTR family DNA-binding domain-containing protein [uncultured Rhodoferax sp.]|uniref:LytR/AlgR family response regulator transcription factor n=1 Tax=uncultured Rhodoferax sp. TaxID=223188 RepID=UPI0025D19AA6|nr:LytTR family DNA-binding domain-containing protein [uncultured Rhodoferax sp.]